MCLLFFLSSFKREREDTVLCRSKFICDMLRCLLRRLESIWFDGSLVWSEHLILSLICIYLCYPRRMYGCKKWGKDQRITEGNDKSSPRRYPAYLKSFIVLFSIVVVFFFALTALFDLPSRPLQPHGRSFHFDSIQFAFFLFETRHLICLFVLILNNFWVQARFNFILWLPLMKC